MILTDESIIQFGAHKGKKLANVPAHYLLWMYDQHWCNKDYKKYIEDNMDVLKKDKK